MLDATWPTSQPTDPGPRLPRGAQGNPRGYDRVEESQFPDIALAKLSEVEETKIYQNRCWRERPTAMPGASSRRRSHNHLLRATFSPVKQVQPVTDLGLKNPDYLHPHRILIRPFGKVLKSSYKLEIN